ncbi:MAG: GAF domain-containing sensor histidine kinase [Anaerolineales bacterium]|nr:GAF domain-containing sensor histidine kinase [Anaerolineales bacterium]
MLLTREQLQDRLIALHQASLELVKDVSLETLLERIANLACQQAEARYTALGVLDDGGKLTQFITVGMSEKQIKRIPHPPKGQGLIGALMDTEATIRLPDISADPRSAGFPPNHTPMHSFLGVPIRVGDRQLGQLYLTEKQNGDEFTQDDEMIIQMFAAYAAVAIENARLHNNARRLAVMEERERIGMDLHDGIIQSIFAVGLSLDSAAHFLSDENSETRQRIQRAIDDLNQTIRDIRTYILDLRPRQFDGLGLMASLARLVTEYRANTLSDATLTGPSDAIHGLSTDHAKILFHICQEALANVARHAKAKTVTISVLVTSARVLMEVQDNGQGFDREKMNMNIGHGLANMQTRAKNAGGDVDISSIPGEGTTVQAWVPREIITDKNKS